jgi:PAS domain S-box-containing protein
MSMEQANEHITFSSLRAKAQKLLQWDPDAINPAMYKNEIRDLLNEYERCQVMLEKKHEEIIELKDREEKILANKYAELFDFSPTGLYTLSETGEILDLNNKASGLLARDKKDLIAHNFSEYLTTDTRENFFNFLKQVFRKQGTETTFVVFTTDQSQAVSVQLNGVATHHANQCLVSVADVTQLNNTMDLLEDLSLIATHTNELAMITDARGNIEYVNPAFERLTGYSNEEIRGQNPGKLLQGPETDPEHIQAFRDGMKKQIPFSQEILNYSRSGEKFWLSISINPIFDTEGNLVKFIAIEINITERKELEELREFEIQDKETLINSTYDPIWSVKNDFTLVAANKAFLDRMQKIIGIRFKKGDNILSREIFDDEIIEYWKNNYTRSLGGESFLLDAQAQRVAGEELEYFETTFNPIYVNNRVEGVACFARNVTESKKIKEAIIGSNRKLQTAQEIAKLGYWEYNLKEQKLFWSPEVYRIWDLDDEDTEITMERYTAKIHPSNRPGLDKFHTAARQGKKHLDAQYRIILNNGKVRWIRETGILIYKSGQGEGYYEGTIQDITSQKEYENHILNINEKLRRLTSHLQNVQEQERINISREIHDELGQQLTGIKLDASWLKGHVNIECPEMQDRLNRLINNIDTTIENVRRIATTLRPGILDDLGLEAAVEWLCSQFQEQTGIKCDLETSTSSSGYSDVINTAVYRIFQEALTNIARHAQATEVKTILKEEKNNLKLYVIDNGKGIGSSSLKSQGSLGITGMKERAWMLDGKFSIKRRKEGGTLMALSIPLKN